MDEVSFALDPALGKLARWLRILGYDAAFGRHLCGRALVRTARSEGRVLLTRDTRILRLEDLPPHLFIRSDHFREQLRQVKEELRLNFDRPVFSRCVTCNVPTRPTPKDRVEGRVPAYVFATQTQFTSCQKCGKIFWRATHYEHVLSELAAMRGGQRR